MLGNLAHREKDSFTNQACDYVTGDQAVITYCIYGPDRDTERLSDDASPPPVFDLHAVSSTKIAFIEN